MISNRMELCPGVWLNMVTTDRFKTGCFSINLLRPLDKETAAINALIPSVLLRGCRQYPDIQSISQRLDELYGTSIGTLIRKKGEVQTVGLYADFLEDRYVGEAPVFESVMDLIGQILFDPCMENGGFCEEYVSGEKQNLINTILSRINDKRSYAVISLLKHMCENERYCVSRLGEKESLETINGITLFECWQDLLATSQIELFYLGQQSSDVVLEHINKLMSHLPPRQTLVKTHTEVICPHRGVQTVEESMNVTQGKLSIGFRTPITVLDERYPALMLLNAVYGSGMTSKLFMRIREEQSLCYYASSSIDRLKGIMVVSSGIEFDKYEIARDGIIEQLDLCKQGMISEDELEAARSYLISGQRTCNDSPGQMDDFIIGQAVAGISGTVADLIESLKKVTKEQVIDAANTLSLDTIYFLKGVDASC